ncbi:phosphatidate cytidylyltransferase [Ferrovibrio sp.]|uniref:phosphatidate cytidylyltransferase n=1 Tax=Ferrovibrio sp. TaxID=1917215 RepID=UPI0035B21FA0
MAQAVNEPGQTAAKPALGGSGLIKRAISAAVLLPLAVAAAWFGDAAFIILVVLSGLLMMWEWRRLPRLCATKGWSSNSLLWTAAGLFYVGLPCLALIWLREQPVHGRHIVFWLFCVVWATDTGAYFAGRTIGGPKLIPSISPNKTWAGLLGGMASASLIGGLVAAINPVLPAFALAGFASFVAVVSQAGDFTESGIKRSFGLKDASHLIPGHGGVLDRLDGLLFAAPFVALCDLLWGHAIWS